LQAQFAELTGFVILWTYIIAGLLPDVLTQDTDRALSFDIQIVPPDISLGHHHGF
jgi:hypothetical protein